MPVNSGSLGTTISFQDLQDFYGGTHPISLSEYYRGGAEVPSTSLSGNNPYTGTTSFSGSGSGSGGSAGIAVTVTTTAGSTVFGSLTTTTISSPSSFSISDPQNVSFVRLGQGGRGNHIINQGGRNLYSVQQEDLQDSTVYVRGPNWQSGDGGRTNISQFITVLSSSGRAGFSGFRTPSGTTAAIGRRTRTVNPSTHDITFTNNTGQRISLNGTGSTSRIMEPGASAEVQSGGSSNSWNFSYNYIDAGTGSGTGDETNDGVVTDVTTNPGMTVPGDLSVQTVGTSSSVGSWFTSGSGPGREGFERINFDSTTAFARLQWGRSQGGNTWTVRDPVGTIVDSGSGNQELLYRGPAWVSGDSGLGRTAAQIAAAPQLSANGVLIIAYRGNASSRGTNVGRGVRGDSITTPTTYDITFRNNTGSDIILDSDSTGGGGSTYRTINNGATAQVADDASSNSWRFDYRFAPSTQPANTAIPESGTTSLDQFNTPGNAAS